MSEGEGLVWGGREEGVEVRGGEEALRLERGRTRLCEERKVVIATRRARSPGLVPEECPGLRREAERVEQLVHYDHH